MNVQILALLILVSMFVLASFLSINLGILALVAAFVVGVGFGGLDADAVIGNFPGDLFVLIVGVTYLFALAQENGTLQRIIDVSMRMVGHRVAAIPWLMFFLAAFVAAAGALSAAAVAIVAPVALRFAAQHKVNPLLMGLMVVQGATAGSFSPLSPFGAITNGLLEGRDLPSDPMGLFVNSLLFNVVAACVVFAVFGGVSLVRRRQREQVTAPTGEPALMGPGRGPGAMARPPADLVGTDDDSDAGAPEEACGDDRPRSRTSDAVHQVATLVAIVGLVLSTMLFGLDVGFVALTLAVALTLLSPNRYGECVKLIPWSAVLLVCGVLTYVGVLSEIGTIDYLSELLTSTGSPLLTALAACYIGGVISAFASTAGVLGASIPLAVPVLEDGMLPMLGTISAIGVASSVVDVSPLSTNGALLVANQKSMEPRLFFRRLLLWSVVVIALAPLLSWLLFVVLL
ncbi:SLC13 family permease [Prauserella oleivorans]|uniref:SLC13 family permease n=1 Tax=Prauserella oleivorans TaxID=1478153 RepID=A0ABW5WDJ7_9PSEU